MEVTQSDVCLIVHEPHPECPVKSHSTSRLRDIAASGVRTLMNKQPAVENASRDWKTQVRTPAGSGRDGRKNAWARRHARLSSASNVYLGCLIPPLRP